MVKGICLYIAADCRMISEQWCWVTLEASTKLLGCTSFEVVFSGVPSSKAQSKICVRNAPRDERGGGD